MKKQCIMEFLAQQPYRQVIIIHNNWCAHNHNDKHIYFIDDLWIESQFPTAVDLYNAIKYKGFNPTKPCCWIDCSGKYHHSSIVSMIDIDAIAEHIINWGDAGYNFIGDINEPLINGFVASYKDTLYEKYSEEDIREKLLKSDADLLMDDWDDILKDVFDVVGICPNCGDAIYTDNPHEYQYETGKTIYECNHCDRVLD